MDIIGCLPLEISQHTLLYLGSEDIDVVWNCMEEWRHIIFNNNFWKKVCRKNNYQENEVCLSSDIYSECMLKHSLHWQAIYTYNRLIQSNWTSDNYKSISIKENKHYETILYFDDEILIADLSYGRFFDARVFVIDIINLSTGNIDFSFTEKKTVKEMLKYQNLLIYFAGKTLKVLNLETKSWILNLELELIRLYGEEIHIEVYNNLLTVLNPPQFFYIINLETKTLISKMLGVLDSCFGNNIIMVLKICMMLQVLDLNGKLLMIVTYGGGLRVQQIMVKAGYVIICHSKIAGQKYQKVSFCTIHQETKSLQEIRSIRVYFRMAWFLNEYTMMFWNRKGLNSSTYKIWRFATENRYIAFDTNQKELASGIANHRYIFMHTEDNILKMWCLKTGKFIQDMTRIELEENFSDSLRVTEKRLAYIYSGYGLRILNYDFIPK